MLQIYSKYLISDQMSNLTTEIKFSTSKFSHKSFTGSSVSITAAASLVHLKHNQTRQKVLKVAISLTKYE